MSPLVPCHYLSSHKDCHFDVGPLLERGWRPRYSNAEMLHESYDWYCANHDLRINGGPEARSEEHTSELQSLMRISYAVFCLKKKKTIKIHLTSYYFDIIIKNSFFLLYISYSYVRISNYYTILVTL